MTKLRGEQATKAIQAVTKDLKCDDEAFKAKEALRKELLALPALKQVEHIGKRVDALTLDPEQRSYLRFTSLDPLEPPQTPTIDTRITRYGQFIKDQCIIH